LVSESPRPGLYAASVKGSQHAMPCRLRRGLARGQRNAERLRAVGGLAPVSGEPSGCRLV